MKTALVLLGALLVLSWITPRAMAAFGYHAPGICSLSSGWHTADSGTNPCPYRFGNRHRRGCGW